jgi:hypothetical protein
MTSALDGGKFLASRSVRFALVKQFLVPTGHEALVSIVTGFSGNKSQKKQM